MNICVYKHAFNKYNINLNVSYQPHFCMLSGIFVPVMSAVAVSTVLVMGVSGLVTQLLIRRSRRGEE